MTRQKRQHPAPCIRIWREVLDAVMLDGEVTLANAKSTIVRLLACLDDEEAWQVFEYLLAAPSGSPPGTYRSINQPGKPIHG